MEKTYQIGVLLGSIQTQHPREIVLGLFDEAKDANVNLTFFLGVQAGENDIATENIKEGNISFNYQYNALYDYSLLGKMDAFIIGYGTLFIFLNNNDRDSFLAKFSDVPIVILEMLEEDSSYNYIMTDNYKGVSEIMDHLINFHGYKKILHLSGPDNNVDASLRKQAYIDSMRRYGLKVTDKMIARGDYTPNVRDAVWQLLDENPDAEAIVSANDEMASTVYEVCYERGLAVGKDIAVTGYDDIEVAQRLDPPLTTVNQDGIMMGHLALKYALDAISNNENNVQLLPTKMCARGSCGCHYVSDSDTKLFMNSYERVSSSKNYTLIFDAAEKAVRYMLRREGSDEVVEQTMKSLVKIIHVLLDVKKGAYTIDDENELTSTIVSELRFLREGGYMQYINTTRFLSCLRQMIGHDMKYCNKAEILLLLHSYEQSASRYVESMIMQENSEDMDRILSTNRSIPAEMQRLMEKSSDDKAFNIRAMELLRDNGINHSYLLLLDDPIILKRNEKPVCPSALYLAASIENGEITYFDVESRIKYDRENGFSSLYSETTGGKYIASILFAEDVQYGILLSEVSVDEVDKMFSISTQLSNALAYKYSTIKEAQTKESLYLTLRELEDKNKLLSYISSNDQLTGIYNRRGFMEKVMEICHKERGKRAFLFFCDLDHLKEINDVFGHGEGDYAIITGAKMLQDVIDNTDAITDGESICGRIGGDEFLIMVLSEDGSTPVIIQNELTKKMADINSKSGKSYYIEFSVGHVDFACSENANLAEILNRADEALYSAKSQRRKSIRKRLF